MRRLLALVLGLCAVQGWGQAAPTADAFAGLHFLDGTWEAKAAGAGGASSLGTYTFAPELGGACVRAAWDGCQLQRAEELRL